MPIIKRFLQLNATIALGGTAFTSYQYPELRGSPVQLVNAAFRGLRTATACTLMAVDYKQAGNNITSETHYRAAGRLYKCFCANGGPYIKMG